MCMCPCYRTTTNYIFSPAFIYFMSLSAIFSLRARMYCNRLLCCLTHFIKTTFKMYERFYRGNSFDKTILFANHRCSDVVSFFSINLFKISYHSWIRFESESIIVKAKFQSLLYRNIKTCIIISYAVYKDSTRITPCEYK